MRYGKKSFILIMVCIFVGTFIPEPVCAQKVATAKAVITVGQWVFRSKRAADTFRKARLLDDKIDDLANMVMKSQNLRHLDDAVDGMQLAGKYGNEVGLILRDDIYLRVLKRSGILRQMVKKTLPPGQVMDAYTFQKLDAGLDGIRNFANFMRKKTKKKDQLNIRSSSFQHLIRQLLSGGKVEEIDEARLETPFMFIRIEEKSCVLLREDYGEQTTKEDVAADLKRLLEECQKTGTTPLLSSGVAAPEFVEEMAREKGVEYFVATSDGLASRLEEVVAEAAADVFLMQIHDKRIFLLIHDFENEPAPEVLENDIQFLIQKNKDDPSDALFFCPGERMPERVREIQSRYPDIHFLAGTPEELCVMIGLWASPE